MPKLEQKPLTWFKRDPRQPRKLPEDDAELTLEQRADLIALGESLKRGQVQPVLTQPDGTLVAGERRWRAAGLVGLATLEAKIPDKPLDESQVRVWQLVENMARADLSGYEQWAGCTELLAANPTWKMQDLAAALGLSPGTVTKLLSPSKLVPVWQEALKAGTVTISDCYAASKTPPEGQAGLLALKLGGATREQLERALRKPREQAAVRAAAVTCRLANGVSVVAKGPDAFSLDEFIDCLADLVRDAKRAREQSLDIKTWQAVLRDRATAR